jgi:CRP/FNR family transcriptional regulator
MKDRPDRCLLCEARLNNPVCQMGPLSAARFSAITTPTNYRAGQKLFSQGDPAGDAFLIRSGQVKLVFQHPDGTEQIVRVAGPGEMLGIGAAIDRHMVVSAIATEAASVCRARMLEIEKLLSSDPEFSLAWAHLLNDEVRRAREAALNLGPQQASTRLSRYILTKVDSRNTGPKPLHELPSLHITHSDLAGVLSIAQETATRLLGDLAERKIVRLSRGKIEVLDLDRLAALAGYPGSEVDLERRA